MCEQKQPDESLIHKRPVSHTKRRNYVLCAIFAIFLEYVLNTYYS